jgi:hypothetical protein
MSSLIINNLPNIEHYSYLELGVNDNVNFNQIKCKNKYSVDMNGNAMFTGTTDEYFNSLPKNTNFDIIFIDANHDYDFVLRDFNNSIDYAKDWILIHDMIPPTTRYTKNKFCSDSYKILYYMLKETDFKIYPMDNNYGLTLVKLPARKIYPSEIFKRTSYDVFIEFMQNIKTYSDDEIIKMLRRNK